jgi:hypothetical protein
MSGYTSTNEAPLTLYNATLRATNIHYVTHTPYSKSRRLCLR